ncbi:unnamed protein product [Rotaria magnacalcarata]|uniref:Uncharacterized protein n=1 Tax=Rotaria magnacalcarata TaxID=392030 RepID=A0A816LSH4_9BILA|nr:unnamed protein product [Rotaria magnacalcarata]CAF1950217.1 unnamed protein product [Rotaria magnacalcarata]
MAPATEHENTENNKVILGATGVTDLQIVKQVLERDYQITALLRNTKKLGYIETKRLELINVLLKKKSKLCENHYCFLDLSTANVVCFTLDILKNEQYTWQGIVIDMAMK